jgi:hypothetical protein
VRDAWSQISDAWNRSDLPGFTKVILLVILGIVLVVNFQFVANIALPLAVIYAIYFAIRAITLSMQPAHAVVQPPPVHPERDVPVAQVASPITPDKKPIAREMKPASSTREQRRWGHRRLRPQLPTKSFRVNVMEVVGGMLMSMIVTGVLFLAVALLRGGNIAPEEFAWVSVVSAVGAWVVLATTKIWEGRKGDALQRRFFLGVGGMGLGVLAFFMQKSLFVPLPHVPNGVLQNAVTHNPAGLPQLPVFVAYYGCFFALLRWWRTTDPLRGARLELFATIAALVMGWLLAMLWGFPLIWGLMTAAAISVASQLSSPWLDVSDRMQITQRGEGTV